MKDSDIVVILSLFLIKKREIKIIRSIIYWRRASALRYNKRRNIAISSYDIDLI